MIANCHIVVVGAGIGGLAAALRLARRGAAVTVLERHAHAGGKIRAMASDAGPVDAGPTVLTLRDVFDDLFADAGARLDDHVTLTPLPVLARHFWPDGTRLDLAADGAETEANVAAAFGATAAGQVRAFRARAGRLWRAFEAPMVRAPVPAPGAALARVLREPSLLAAMAPHRSLAGTLRGQFDDPRLAQLYGRYATYVGGMPARAPAVLALVSQAEAAGVWSVEGGMQALPSAIAALAKARGASIRHGATVRAIARRRGGGLAVETGAGALHADAVVFNGDPRALATGALGPAVARAVPRRAVAPRSLSACVLAFAARVTGPALSHHNVFFGDDPEAEFRDLARGRLPADPTLYVCAQDHARPDAPGRFEIILNAPYDLPEEDTRACLTTILDRLRTFGLTFDPPPGRAALTTPQGFAALFPASLGSLYGRSPEGAMAAFARPLARTRVPGLYLAGGGAHPGAGMPMAALSGRHAAEAILEDLRSTSTSARAATRGGTSTGSATTASAPSRSSPS